VGWPGRIAGKLAIRAFRRGFKQTQKREGKLFFWRVEG